MPFARRLTHVAVLASAGALVAGTMAAAPAIATSPSAGITVLLKAPHPAQLRQLAQATGLSRAQRMAELSRLLPSAAAHQQAVDDLRAQGFTIGHETAWTIDATAPQPTVTSALGTSRLRSAAIQAVPAGLSSVAAAVIPDVGATGLFSPSDVCPGGCHDGGDFRNAYTAPKTPPATGVDHKAKLTIATLQFADWNDGDLTKYAANNSLPKGDPVASGQYKQFGVKGTKLTGATVLEKGADEEVDLDQESLLSTDPQANQRAYFDTNSRDGYVQALSQVLADVTEGKGASSDGGDPHIVALSSSWGSCEADFRFNFPGDTMAAVEHVLESISAAGVTIFAATGDDGIYDCAHSASSTQVAADYPASSPVVIGVGATRLKSVGGDAANDGTNWTDRAWTCASASACESAKGTGGTGGGESSSVAMPAYQRLGIGHQPFRTSTGKKGDFGTQPHRLIPDIAVDGDPQTGFSVLTSDPTDTCPTTPLPPLCTLNGNAAQATTSLPIGGTSLSAPVSAALFTNMLAAHGVTAGVGDVHGALYSAYADKVGAFRDVTSGANGKQKDVDAAAAHHKAAELPVNARTGYDTVSGLGAPYWARIAPYIFTPSVPNSRVKARLTTPHRRKNPYRVTASWAPRSHGSHPVLAGSAKVTVTDLSKVKAFYTGTNQPAAGHRTFAGKPGHSYVISVTERDLGGHLGKASTTTFEVPYDDHAFKLRGAWSRVRAGRDFGGSHVVTASTSATAKIRSFGQGYGVVVLTGPTLGKLAVFHGSKRVKVIDLYSPRVHRRTITFFGGHSAPLARRTFTFRATGSKNRFSTGRAVDLDGFAVLF